MNTVNKVYAYITHQDRLLVLDHVAFPDELPQVPGGTQDEGEHPEAAVIREAAEETGLEGLQLVGFLGQVDFTWTGSSKVFRRRFYHLKCHHPHADRWQHYEEHPSAGTEDRILFELYWVDLPDGVPHLAPGHEAFLDQLVRRMKLRS